ncbi:hypothetical protein HYS00_03515 [Candidatus Microgenomates bacterium]|nr:hypothetical protein [Candidatus Microgenomates bacterium]
MVKEGRIYGLTEQLPSRETREIDILKTPFETRAILAPIDSRIQTAFDFRDYEIPTIDTRAKNNLRNHGITRIDQVFGCVPGVDETTPIPTRDPLFDYLREKGTMALRTDVNGYLQSQPDDQTDQIERDISRIRAFREAFHEVADVVQPRSAHSGMKDALFYRLVLATPQTTMAGFLATDNHTLMRSLVDINPRGVIRVADELRARYA